WLPQNSNSSQDRELGQQLGAQQADAGPELYDPQLPTPAWKRVKESECLLFPFAGEQQRCAAQSVSGTKNQRGGEAGPDKALDVMRLCLEKRCDERSTGHECGQQKNRQPHVTLLAKFLPKEGPRHGRSSFGIEATAPWGRPSSE